MGGRRETGARRRWKFLWARLLREKDAAIAGRWERLLAVETLVKALAGRVGPGPAADRLREAGLRIGGLSTPAGE